MLSTLTAASLSLMVNAHRGANLRRLSTVRRRHSQRASPAAWNTSAVEPEAVGVNYSSALMQSTTAHVGRLQQGGRLRCYTASFLKYRRSRADRGRRAAGRERLGERRRRRALRARLDTRARPGGSTTCRARRRHESASARRRRRRRPRRPRARASRRCRPESAGAAACAGASALIARRRQLNESTVARRHAPSMRCCCSRALGVCNPTRRRACARTPAARRTPSPARDIASRSGVAIAAARAARRRGATCATRRWRRCTSSYRRRVARGSG